MKAAESSLEVGALLADRYTVRGCTLEGPVYVDYRVHDQEVEVELSLWFMDPGLFADEADRAAFERAARDMRGVLNPNLRRLFEVGRLEEAGTVYLTSQLGSPDRVASRLGSGSTASDSDILRYAEAMADALEAVHAAGQVHGRLVPADLVEVAGVIKISGAGLYGRLDPALAAGRWWEQRRYLAPEVLEGSEADPRSDVYSMAAILCELASGVSAPDLADATEQLAAERLSLADLLARALSRLPERRPGRPVELVELIRQGLVDDRVATVRRLALIDAEALGTGELQSLQVVEQDEEQEDERDDSGPLAAEEGEGRTVEEVPPSFLQPSAAQRSRLFAPNQPTWTDQRTLLGLPPRAGALPMAASQVETQRGLVVPPPSRRDPVEPRPRATPMMPALDRRELQPIQRPLSSSSLPEPSTVAFDRYAPPRGGVPEEKRSILRRRLLVFMGISAACLLGGLALVLAQWEVRKGRPEKQDGEGARAGIGRSDQAAAGRPPVAAQQDSPPAPAPSLAPPPPAGPCPDGMVLVAGKLLDEAREPFCIDGHESPGEGQMPQVGVSLEEAAAGCQTRAARLCKPGEWEDACRGPDKASFPYGGKFVDWRCNARGIQIAAAGSFPECVSAAGAYDMSGNAAEWDADGGVRGASATDRTRGRCSELRQNGKPRVRPRDRADIGFRCCADPLAKVTPAR